MLRHACQSCRTITASLNSYEREVFWVNELVSAIDEFDPNNTKVLSNTDDSNGGHDALICLGDGTIVGVQVTELTYDLGNCSG